MRTSTILSAAICALSSVANASVSDITIPAVIRIGKTFVANFTTPIQQPRDRIILWGMGPPSAKVGENAGWAEVGMTKLYSSDTVDTDGPNGRNYFWQAQNLQIPAGVLSKDEKQVAIQAAVIGYLGAAGNLFIRNYYWKVNVTSTGETSFEQIGPVVEKTASGYFPPM